MGPQPPLRGPGPGPPLGVERRGGPPRAAGCGLRGQPGRGGGRREPQEEAQEAPRRAQRRLPGGWPPWRALDSLRRAWACSTHPGRAWTRAWTARADLGIPSTVATWSRTAARSLDRVRLSRSRDSAAPGTSGLDMDAPLGGYRCCKDTNPHHLCKPEGAAVHLL